MRPSLRTTLKIALAVALVGAAIGFISGPGSGDPPRASAQRAEARAEVRTFAGLNPLEHRVEDGVAVADLDGGRTALLSLDPALQDEMTRLYARYEVPYGGLVAIEPRTGRVLAYVSHSSAEPGAGDLAVDPSPPTASVFKVITAAALVDAGVSPTQEVCYHGGVRRLQLANLEDNPSLDRRCANLGDAMGGSINAIFAKLADRHLDRATLARYASAFGFGQALPFDVPTRASATEIPDERLERARTAAGFWHNHMSPLHGALIAATIANDGRMPRATIVDQVIDGRGRVSYRQHPRIFREVIPRATARAVGQMMERTVTHGTARSFFYDPHRQPFLPGITVAGKTGTLATERPYRGYTWFVGYAPVDNPQIAVAALVINEPRWRIKAAFAAREAMRHWLVERPRLQAAAARRAAQEAGQAQAATSAQAAE